MRVFSTQPVQSSARVRAHSVKAMLESFPQEDRDHMVENGAISVTCEDYCSSKYVFAPEDVGAHRLN